MIAPAEGTFRWDMLAVIREADCIGCARCLKACPVDAILGASKQMHTVIAHECTGCALCIPACPVDCIDLHPAAIVTHPQGQRLPYPAATQIERACTRLHARECRLNRKRDTATKTTAHRRREIFAAVMRVRARRNTARS